MKYVKTLLLAAILTFAATNFGFGEDVNDVNAVAVAQADTSAGSEAVDTSTVKIAEDQAQQGGEVSEAAQESAAVEQAQQDGAQSGSVSVQTDASGDIQSLTFSKGMSIRDALRFLSAQYHRNIVPSVKVDGPITVTNLYDVSFDEALVAICGRDYNYNEESGFIKVYTSDEWKKIQSDKSRMEYRVFTLYYITAEDAAKLVVALKSEFGSIAVSTPAEREISGAVADGANTGGALATTGGGDSFANNDTLVMHDFPEYIAKVEAVLAKVDTRPKQVLVEATIMSATLQEGMEFGVDLNFLAGVNLTSISDIPDITDGTPIATSGFAGTESGSGLKVGVTSGDFTALITALETITDTTILANPKILAVNKQEGSVLIGQNLGYRSSTSVSGSGVATEGEVKFLKTGTQLVFRPYIGSDGYIRMEIYPKDSTAELDDDGVPTETTTELKSNIMVREGETIVIGGLFRDATTSSKNQVPILGDIPIIGAAFRSTTNSVKKQEVIILLTPHIIDAANQTDGVARAEDVSRKRYGAVKSLDFISRARIAEEHYAKAVDCYYKGDKAKALVEVQAVLATHPTHYEATALKDKIVRETSPDDSKLTNRIMIDKMNREQAGNWLRR